MSTWFIQKNPLNGAANPGTLGQFGVTAGEQLGFYINAVVQSTSGASATATITLSVSDASGNQSSVTLPPLDLTVQPNAVNGSVAAPLVAWPGPPSSYFSVSCAIAWTGSAGDGQIAITVSKK